MAISSHLLGPSGCGKTRCCAVSQALRIPDSGEIRLGNQVIYSSAGRVNVPPNRRGLGMVFQSTRHLAAHGCRRQRRLSADGADAARRILTRPKWRKRVADLLDLIQIRHLANRKATRLSGGRQQRWRWPVRW